MLDKDEFEKFLLYGMDGNVSIKKCIENALLILFFSLPLLIWKWGNFVWLFLGILPFALHIISAIKLSTKGKIERENFILYNGIMAINFSLMFALLGIAICLYLFHGEKRIAVIGMLIIIYIIVILLYIYMIKRMIEKKAFSNAQQNNGIMYTSIFAGLGMLTARTFMSELSNDSAIKILCFCCFILSLAFLLGVVNIVKFYYIKKFLNTDELC